MGIANLLVLSFVIALVAEAAPRYDVLGYGAAGNATTDDVQAFLKAWSSACADTQSPTFVIPAQKKFLLSQILFQGPCKSSIHVQIEGTIVRPSEIWTENYDRWISFHDIENLTIDGSGLIDGQGSLWWSCKDQNKCDHAPKTFAIEACKHVRISDLRFVDSPGKHVAVHGCVGVDIRNLEIIAPGESPNTDGISIFESQHVEVTDCNIGTGDDCIAVGSGSSFVNISRIRCGPGHGISIGSLGGSGSEATVEDIMVFDCSFTNTMNGARIKTWQGGSGYARAISFERIRFDSVDVPIIIDQYYCNGKHNCRNLTSAVKVSDVSFVDAMGTGSKDVAIKLACSETVPCTGIVLRDVHISLASGSNKESSYCLNAVGKQSGQVSPEVSCLSWTN